MWVGGLVEGGGGGGGGGWVGGGGGGCGRVGVGGGGGWVCGWWLGVGGGGVGWGGAVWFEARTTASGSLWTSDAVGTLRLTSLVCRRPDHRLPVAQERRSAVRARLIAALDAYERAIWRTPRSSHERRGPRVRHYTAVSPTFADAETLSSSSAGRVRHHRRRTGVVLHTRARFW